MSTEHTWVTVPSWVIYTGSDQYQYTREILFAIKNNLVAYGGWTVIGSSNHTVYEYEGVTAGGVYGGASTGPYDVWASTTDIPMYADGSGPSWCLLQGPTYEGKTPYIVIGREGTSQAACIWFQVCDDKWSLHPDGAGLYMPVAPTGSTSFGWSRHQGYYSYGGNYTRRAFMSMCPETGSFILPLNLTIRTWFTCMYAFFRLDPYDSIEPHMGAFLGQANGLGSSEYTPLDGWKAGQPELIYPDTVSPSYTDQMWWGMPERYSVTQVFATDLPGVNCDGEVDLLPLYVTVPPEISNIEYKCGIVGRVLDGWACPQTLSDGDTLPAASPEYCKVGYWMFPADVAPVLGP